MSRSHGQLWLESLAGAPAEAVPGTPSVLSASIDLGGIPALALAVVPDAQSRMPRAAHGEMGLEQAWTLAARIRQLIADEQGMQQRTPILAIVDTPGQAFGRIEEERCISAACAAAVEAYADARRAGHPLLALVVGRAISGSFLAHGLQSGYILALGSDDVMMHAMSQQSIARITRRTVREVAADAAAILPMSYAIQDAHALGIIDAILPDVSADAPTSAHIADVRAHLAAALTHSSSMQQRIEAVAANPHRHATAAVRQALRAQWNKYPL